MNAFRDLHTPGRPLMLPNAWDHASGAALAAKGFSAIGTTSLGIAAANGKPDGAAATREETLALVRGLVDLPCLITADIEGGFGGGPAEVAELAAELAGMGVAGVNIEDGLPDGTLAPADVHSALVAAIKDRVPPLFVNARTDVYWLTKGPLEEAVRRARAYEEAGADGIFVPGLPSDDTISALVREVDLPLNVLYTPGGHTYAELAALGVRRISCGSLLFRIALQSAVAAATSIAGGGTIASGVLGYDDVQALISPRV